jgi:hypothetical protein
MNHPTPTAQEIFETAARHLFKQGRKAVDGNTCAYLASNGTQCAFGVLIPKGAPFADYEGKGSASVITMLAIANIIDFRPHAGLIRNLQDVHDNFPGLEFDDARLRWKLEWAADQHLRVTGKALSIAFLADLHIETAP